jgi:hypothetical protein
MIAAETTLAIVWQRLTPEFKAGEEDEVVGAMHRTV